jgi:hypothetical protein
MTKEHFLMKKVGLLGALLFSFSLTSAAPANAQPDLVINEKDSRIYAGSCLTSEPLASGRIAIKNIGTEAASFGLSETFRSILAVWVPENIDMIAKIKEKANLKPLDQEGLAFELAKGVLKKGRFFLSISKGQLQAAQKQLSNRNRAATIQTALSKLGFDPRGIDGVIGSNTRTAIRAFQGDQGAARTGTLTTAQFQKLIKEAGIQEFDNATGANGVTKVTLYAQVDPYNLIEESNEANNIRKFEVTIDCSN